MPPVIRDHVGLWDSDQPDGWSPQIGDLVRQVVVIPSYPFLLGDQRNLTTKSLTTACGTLFWYPSYATDFSVSGLRFRTRVNPTCIDPKFLS